MIWLLGLFFTTLFVGMSPMEISAGLLTLFIIIVMWRRYSGDARGLFLLTHFDFLFIVWIVAITASFLMNGITDQTIPIKLIEFKWILFLYFLVFGVVRSRLDEGVLPWITIPAILFSAYAIIIAFGGIDLIKNEPLQLSVTGGIARTGGLFSDSMALAHVYGIIFCWFFGLLLTFGRYRDRKAIWIFFATLALGLTVLLTFTRGMWLAMGIASLVMAFIFSRKLGIFVSILSGVLFEVLFSFWPSFHQRINQSLSGTEGYDSERLWIWKANWQIFREHPILGVGYGENRTLMAEYFKKIGAPESTLISHAHNQYLHFLAGTGVIGLLIYLLVLFMFFRLSVKTWNRISDRYPFHRGICLGLIGSQIAFFVGGLTEANFESAKIKYTMVMTWALVLWLAYEYRVLKSRNFRLTKNLFRNFFT